MLALGGIVLVAAALLLAFHIPRTMTIFLIAAFIAFGAQPLVVRLEERGVRRPLAIAIVYVVLLLILVLGLVLVVPAVFAQMQVLVQNAPAYLRETQDWVVGAEDTIRRHLSRTTLPAHLTNVQQFASENVTAFLAASMASLGTWLLDAATAVFVGVSSLVLSIFFLLQDEHVADVFAGLFPPRQRETARIVASEIAQIFGNFIAGQVIVSAITGILIGLLCAIVGFRYALVIGVLSGVAYAVPIVGMIVIHILAAIVAAPQGVWMIVYVEAILFTVGRISDNILVPKIMGTSVGVSPIGVMFAVFAGGELFGLPGLLLGIPAAALIKVVWRYFVAPMLHGAIEIVPSTSDIPDGLTLETISESRPSG